MTALFLKHKNSYAHTSTYSLISSWPFDMHPPPLPAALSCTFPHLRSNVHPVAHQRAPRFLPAAPNQQFSAASFPSQLPQTPLPAHPLREHGAKGSRRTEPPVLLHQSLVPDISDWNNLGRRVRFAPVLEVLNTTNFHH